MICFAGCKSPLKDNHEDDTMNVWMTLPHETTTLDQPMYLLPIYLFFAFCITID